MHAGMNVMYMLRFKSDDVTCICDTHTHTHTCWCRLVLSVAEKDVTNSTAARNAGECRKPHWIRFSASQVALAAILITASAYLTVKLKRAKTDTSITAWKTMTLWSLVGA